MDAAAANKIDRNLYHDSTYEIVSVLRSKTTPRARLAVLLFKIEPASLGFNFVLIGIYNCKNTPTMSNCARLSRMTLVRQVSGRIGKSSRRHLASFS